MREVAGRSLPVPSLWGCGAWRSVRARSIVVFTHFPVRSLKRGGNAAASTIVLLRTKSGIWNLRLGVAGEESGGAAKV